MDMQDLDEEEKARRKKDIVEYRTKKTKSTIFMICAAAFEIVETALIMLVLFLLVSFVLFRCFNPQNPTIQVLFEVFSILIFIGSMFIGFLIYKKVMRWVIVKFKLEDVLLKDVLEHYIKKSKSEIEEELRR